MVVDRVQQMSVEEFLDFAESSEEHYEFIDGELYPVTTAKYSHNVICYNLGFHLGILLAGEDCQVLGQGQGVKSGEARFLIPDLSVVFGRALTDADSRLLLNPILVAEVTSPTSLDRDRILKREYYWDVESIQAYLIVDQQRPLVELHARGETDWQIQRFSDLRGEVPLEALGCRLPLSDIYRRVEFDDAPPALADDR